VVTDNENWHNHPKTPLKMVKVHVGNRHTDLYPTAKNSATFLFLYVNLDE